jgi:hypothetical protein
MRNKKSVTVTKKQVKVQPKKKGRVLGRSIEQVAAPKTVSKNNKKEETKATKKTINIAINPESFSKTFDHPVRAYWNRRFEKKNSSCVKAGTALEFEQINVRKDGVIEYRVRRGKRNFFTTSNDMKAEA